MLFNLILIKKNQWLNSSECNIKYLIDYIRTKDQLRETQIEAIETYLFLKIKGENKPLWVLFSEGFFINNHQDLSKLNINQQAREFLENNISARALFEFSRMKVNGESLLPDLERLILDRADELNYSIIIKSIFYNVDYADYLFSLPMGAGKTFLMVAFIYLDLYFAQLEQENKNFAHNFLVLVPSGLKSSIIPSLKTIENFDPSWVLSEPAASNLKRILKFEVLAQPKTGKKSNKARNPNAQKVNQYISQQDLMGLVLVVNAEKVILDRIDVVKIGETYKAEFHASQDEKDKIANELRNLIGKIPNLQILIDEVHHAATDDVKLRKVVNKWNAVGNVTTVLGFSGTPYLSSPDKIFLDENSFLRFSQITNTVYYYSLLSGIKSFLKKPTVKIAVNVSPLKIIEKGIEDFYSIYKDKVYDNGTIAKLAIYCGKIPRLETEIAPLVMKLVSKYGDSEENVLKYHKGNKEFKLPKKYDLEFLSLDQPFSKKRVILLVQIGKEGWDCKSLTGVILSQKGDSPTNMVLQTSSRPLRQVDKNKAETALVWLNEHNAKILNKQLKDGQHTSIEEINKADKEKAVYMIERSSRMEFLELPLIDFYQLKVEYKTISVEHTPNTELKLNVLLNNIVNYKKDEIVKTRRNFREEIVGGTIVITTEGTEIAVFDYWLYEIAKQSFNTISFSQLQKQEKILNKIFNKVTYSLNGKPVFNDLYDRISINSQIRLSFKTKRKLETNEELIPEKSELLIASNLKPFEKNLKYYPPDDDVKKILNLDKRNSPVEIDEKKIKKFYEAQIQTFKDSGMDLMMPDYETFRNSYDLSLAVKSKNQTFHYLPYNFWQSTFEMNILEAILKLKVFSEFGLEVYYNGERTLSGFVIKCFVKEGKYLSNIGKYTPDFLIIKRKNKTDLFKVLILETKGKGYASQPEFIEKRNYVETEFLEKNNIKFNYKRFDFLYIQDDEKNPEVKLSNKFLEFFKD